jgi:hypothetical protein
MDQGLRSDAAGIGGQVSNRSGMLKGMLKMAVNPWTQPLGTTPLGPFVPIAQWSSDRGCFELIDLVGGVRKIAAVKPGQRVLVDHLWICVGQKTFAPKLTAIMAPLGHPEPPLPELPGAEWKMALTTQIYFEGDRLRLLSLVGPMAVMNWHDLYLMWSLRPEAQHGKIGLYRVCEPQLAEMAAHSGKVFRKAALELIEGRERDPAVWGPPNTRPPSPLLSGSGNPPPLPAPPSPPTPTAEAAESTWQPVPEPATQMPPAPSAPPAPVAAPAKPGPDPFANYQPQTVPSAVPASNAAAPIASPFDHRPY